MPDAIDGKIAELTKTLSTSKGADASFWVKTVSGVLVALYMLYLKYQLAAKEKALAEARTEIALAKFQAQQDLVKQRLDMSEKEREAAENAARDHLDKVIAHETAIAAEEKNYVEQVKKVVALKNWDDVNKAAGVHP
jgi:hypothetical protein